MKSGVAMFVSVLAACGLAGCAPVFIVGDPEPQDDDDLDDDDAADDDDLDDDDLDDDDADDDTGDDDTDSDRYICGFEIGDLTGFGYPNYTWYTSDEGGITQLMYEGDDFSGLLGEEGIEYAGDVAVVLRSDASGDPSTAGTITTNLFVPQVPTFLIEQVSEVDERGVALELEILSEDGLLLEARPLAVETGGHIPGLEEFHDPIPDFPEITTTSATAGTFVLTVIDLTSYHDSGQAIQLRIRQHTVVDGIGFFTLLDNLCNLEP